MKQLNDISNRTDVHHLVSQFYKKVRNEPVLGPIFNKSIKVWPIHLNRITDFWETSLLNAKTYDGNPVVSHQKLDKAENQTIEMYHFGLWINLWKETVNELYQGEIADLAIRRAKNMASILFIKMFESRS